MKYFSKLIRARDNIDRLEETLNGGDTSHRMNRITIQFRSIQRNAQNTRTDNNTLVPDGRKNIRILVENSTAIPQYITRRKIGPKRVQKEDSAFDQIHHEFEVEEFILDYF